MEENVHEICGLMARWLAVPASLNRAVAGARQHRGKQETKMESVGLRRKHGCFHALDLVLLGAAVDEDQYLAHTSCIWFLHGQRTRPSLCNWVSTEMCRRRSADVSRYSYTLAI